MKKITDEQLDFLIKNLLIDSALDQETLDEIADSPNILWNIKRNINQTKSKKQNGWIWEMRWLIPVFTSFGLLLTVGLSWFSYSPIENNEIAQFDTTKTVELISPQEKVGEINPTETVNPIKPTQPVNVEKKPHTVKTTSSKIENSLVKNVETKKENTKFIKTKTESKITATPKPTQTKTVRQNTTKVSPNQTNIEEYKTDFIALTYLSTPESGQIVRVKVPRAMMVSLGVSNNVSKNDELVNAEVILGDDGTSRAIRFISDGKK